MTYDQLRDHCVTGHGYTVGNLTAQEASTAWDDHARFHRDKDWGHRHQLEPWSPYQHTGAPVPA